PTCKKVVTTAPLPVKSDAVEPAASAFDFGQLGSPVPELGSGEQNSAADTPESASTGHQLGSSVRFAIHGGSRLILCGVTLLLATIAVTGFVQMAALRSLPIPCTAQFWVQLASMKWQGRS